MILWWRNGQSRSFRPLSNAIQSSMELGSGPNQPDFELTIQAKPIGGGIVFMTGRTQLTAKKQAQ